MESTIHRRDVRTSLGEPAVGLSVAFIVLTGLVCALRVWSRWINRAQKIGIDDWTAVAAWPLVFAFFLTVILAVRHGIGAHVDTLSASDITLSVRYLIAAIVIYYPCIAMIRISAGLYYCRLFGQSSRAFRWCVWSSIVANVIWFIGIAAAAFNQCDPPEGLWNPLTTPGAKCNLAAHQYACSVTSVVLDLVSLLLPLPMIWRLHLRQSKKRGVVAIFVVGYCVPILTIGRLITTVVIANALTIDPTWNFALIVYWVIFEVFFAFNCICLPALFYLLRSSQIRGTSAAYFSGGRSRRANGSAAGAGGPKMGPRRPLESQDSEAGLDSRELAKALQQRSEGEESVSNGENALTSNSIIMTTTYTVSSDVADGKSQTEHPWS